MQKILLNSLVVYKTKPALVKDCGEKFTIVTADKNETKVREKDIEFLHPGPLANLTLLCDVVYDDTFNKELCEVWELCLSSGDASLPDIKELTELIFNDWSAVNAWKTYRVLCDGLYFYGGLNDIKIRTQTEVEAEKQKRGAKKSEAQARTDFLQRVKNKSVDIENDSRFMQDIEALALGKVEKSKTMHELGLPEDPVAAHRLLLETGFWPLTVNPHPSRHCVSLNSAKEPITAPPVQDRTDLSGLAVFAVDSKNSTDPDDAVSLVLNGDETTLYVHVADPAASVSCGSKADIEARERGATLYAPEGAARMLSDEALTFYALGLSEISPALTIKIILNSDSSIKDTEIFLSNVKVTRLSYEEADENADFAPFFDLMEKNIRRRREAGAVFIDFPEVKVYVSDGVPEIMPVKACKSAIAVRECMLLAGEAAAGWALRRNLPFPYISQRTEGVIANPQEGLAGSYQLRRCMMPRTLSVQPALHQGLGLDIYTQITSPLRRYTDLLCHQQIHAFLSNAEPLDKDTLALHLAVSERGALNTVRAERASRTFWLAVYLKDKIGSVWDAVVLDIKGPHLVLFVTELGFETQAACKNAPDIVPGKTIQIKLSSVKIPESEINFVCG